MSIAASQGGDKTYYSIKESESDYSDNENLETVATATLTGGATDVNYKCTAKVTVSVLQSDTAATITFEENEAKVKLQGNNGWNLGEETEFDLSSLKEQGYVKTFDNVTLDLTGNGSSVTADIKGQLSITNFKNTDQTDRLKGQEFNVKIEVTNFKCDTVAATN